MVTGSQRPEILLVNLQGEGQSTEGYEAVSSTC